MRLLPCDFKDSILNLLRLQGPSNEVKVLNSTQVKCTCSHLQWVGVLTEWGARGSHKMPPDWWVEPSLAPIQIRGVCLLPVVWGLFLPLAFYARNQTSPLEKWEHSTDSHHVPVKGQCYLSFKFHSFHSWTGTLRASARGLAPGPQPPPAASPMPPRGTAGSQQHVSTAPGSFVHDSPRSFFSLPGSVTEQNTPNASVSPAVKVGGRDHSHAHVTLPFWKFTRSHSFKSSVCPARATVCLFCAGPGDA